LITSGQFDHVRGLLSMLTNLYSVNWSLASLQWSGTRTLSGQLGHVTKSVKGTV